MNLATFVIFSGVLHSRGLTPLRHRPPTVVTQTLDLGQTPPSGVLFERYRSPSTSSTQCSPQITNFMCRIKTRVVPISSVRKTTDHAVDMHSSYDCRCDELAKYRVPVQSVCRLLALDSPTVPQSRIAYQYRSSALALQYYSLNLQI